MTDRLTGAPQAAGRMRPAWSGAARAAEDAGVAVSLSLMAVLPVLEIVLRKLLGTGISGSAALVQHLVLVVSMLGAAVAAREGRLLSLATTEYLKENWKAGARMFSSAFAAAITGLLCAASAQFVLSRRAAAETLAYGIPLWTVQLVLPVGFGLIAARLLWSSSPRWSGRAAAAAIAAALVCAGALLPLDPERLVTPALVLLGIATVLGAPVFVTLGGAALILFWGGGQPIALIPVDQYRLVVNPTLPSIPLFTLAGYFLAEGGASKRLVRVFEALVGWLRGGPAIVTALVCAFFTALTGASGVTILALGGLLMPVLLAERYPEKSALGLLTGAGSLGLLFPPSLPLILYAVISSSAGTEVSIRQMFLGGIGPGTVMLALTIWWGVRQSPADSAARRKFNASEALSALRAAKWEMLLPVVALVTLFGGFATPVEASAVTALYAFFVEVVLHRDLKLFRDVPRVMAECGLMVGGVLLILGVAMGLTDYLFDARVPELAVDWARSALHSRWEFLLALNVFLLGVGCLMDVFSAIVVIAPLIIPIGQAFGVDPVHLGIVFLANLQLGYLTPPVGMNLFLSSYRFGKPMGEVISATMPMLLVLLLGVLATTYIPPLATTLPKLFP